MIWVLFEIYFLKNVNASYTVINLLLAYPHHHFFLFSFVFYEF